jgi:deazaflavin-dependent oxidoreductase (nitroreductase family)
MMVRRLYWCNRIVTGCDRWAWKHLRLLSTWFAFPPAILEVPGRKSGIMRRCPTVYFRADDGCIYLVASNGGRAGDPQWFKNIEHASVAGLTVTYCTREHLTGWDRCEYQVEIPDAQEQSLLWSQMSQIAPFLRCYLKLKHFHHDMVDRLPVVRLRAC